MNMAIPIVLLARPHQIATKITLRNVANIIQHQPSCRASERWPDRLGGAFARAKIDVAAGKRLTTTISK